MNIQHTPQQFSPAAQRAHQSVEAGRAFATSYRNAAFARADNPRGPDEKPHRRAIEMATVMQDIAASRGAATFRDMISAGFTTAEIIEFGGQAQNLAAEWKSESRSGAFDCIEEMAIKVRQPLPNRPPMTENYMTSPGFFLAWGKYCAGRAALLLDPWAAQRERCLCLLQEFLNTLPLLPAERARLVQAADSTLPKIQVRNSRAVL
ncbi:hypothetical protein C5748_16275 [Phyllobacterium phragmitis]|uniref:Uncharacterized protein n=1 Tax=Phyllobacterium phragmitis TaxID=2670329 RepID=A0A2S9IP92_9HYPH|nr:hypothetical protein [Phyllobacterium phragmitis]PRD42349.1 hypothetical protein C5748_16275 [Phyllobacterium phragmitis]